MPGGLGGGPFGRQGPRCVEDQAVLGGGDQQGFQTGPFRVTGIVEDDLAVGEDGVNAGAVGVQADTRHDGVPSKGDRPVRAPARCTR
ncbi:hypothetical protein ACFVRU_13790, partial [Streptomyces sp. NPDC057927]